MSISKLRSRHAVLTRQEHIKSPSSGGSASGGGDGGGVCRANITAAANADAAEIHKTAKSTTHAATTKQLNTAAVNAVTSATATAISTAAPQQPTHQRTPQAAQTYVPQTSLLKIEPFVPSLTTRLRRNFGRSYTTLSTTAPPNAVASSSGSNKRKGVNNTNAANALNSPLLGAAIDSKLAKANAASTRAAVAARLRRNPVRAIVTRQRSKSTSSSASNRPTTAQRNLSPNMLLNGEHGGAATAVACASNGGGSGNSSASGNGNGGGNSNTAVVTLQPNGICRIARAAQERDKQPDRINYDRRGLSAIPIFEHETQLRLLSLQHNLINIFHIPKEEPLLAPAPAPLPPGAVTAATHAEGTHSPEVPSELLGSEQNTLEINNGVCSPKPLRGQNERVAVGRINCTAGSTSGAGSRFTLALRPAACVRQLNGNLLTPPPPPPTPLGQLQQQLPHAAPHQIYQQLMQQRLGTANNNVNALKSLHYNAPLLPLARQPTPCRFALKRSKSFVSNIPRNLQSIQQNLLKTQLARVKLGAAGADAHLKSFDSSTSNSELTNTTDSSPSSILATSTTNTNGTTFVGSDREEDDPLQQLTVKNRQLVASYGMIFQHLVFLDLYDNQIERIGNLDGLPALSVLLLGKNRLTDISGLASLRETLRVLDLHGNKITNIGGKLSCLQELKSLNLAGNLLRQIGPNDFCDLTQLRELNLKRNKIKRINGFHHLTALERLWLCHNELHRVDDMASIAKATNLLEVTIENNPVSLAGDCVSFLVSYLPRLQTLSQMPITEQVRAAAMSWRRNKEISDTHYAHLTPDAYQCIKREEVISNARTNWELLRSQQTLQQSAALQRQTQQRSPTPSQSTYTIAPRIAKPSELARINESNEAVADATEEGVGALVATGLDTELQEFIKLPPIQQQEQPQQQQQEHRQRQMVLQQTQTPAQTRAQSTKSGQTSITKPNLADRGPTSATLQTKAHNVQPTPPHNVSNDVKHSVSKNNNVDINNSNSNNNNVNSARFSGSSGSSLGPNVHSSSSCFSSDNEDSTELAAQQRITRTHKYQKTVGQKQQQKQQRRHGNNSNECNGDNAVGRRKIDATQKASDLKPTNESGNADAAGRAANKVNSAAAVAHEQVATVSADLATKGSGELQAAGITAKQKPTTNDDNESDARHLPTQPPTQAAAAANGTAKAGESISQADSNSSALMASRAASNASTTTMAQQKVSSATTTTTTNAATSITTSVVSAATAQITNHGGLLSLGFKEPTNTAVVQPPQQTNGTASGFVGATTRTPCRRLTRSQTIVGASHGGTNNSPTTAANNGNEPCGGKRTANNGSKPATNAAATPSNGQASAQPTVTCIVAPPPINTTNNNNSNTAGGQRASAANKTERETREREREREQGGDYLIEICGRYLNVYGQGALRYIDKQWNAAKAQDVHTLNFSYINFNNIAATVLGRIKSRFPNAENFVFRETNIEFIGQLNALGELQGISALTIDPEGNAITTKDLWREYAIYRLSHWGLKLINGVAVTEADIEASNTLYEGLSDLVLWAMPASMLQPLLARLRLDETCTASKMSPKEWLMKPENKSLRLVVGKEALQWKKPNTNASTATNANNGGNNVNGISGQHQQPMPYAVSVDSSVGVGVNTNANINTLSVRERGRLHFATMLENTVNAVEKVHMLETLWPSMLLDIVRNALLDYSHLDEYLHSVMDEIMK